MEQSMQILWGCFWQMRIWYKPVKFTIKCIRADTRALQLTVIGKCRPERKFEHRATETTTTALKTQFTCVKKMGQSVLTPQRVLVFWHMSHGLVSGMPEHLVIHGSDHVCEGVSRCYHHLNKQTEQGDCPSSYERASFYLLKVYREQDGTTNKTQFLF